MNNTTNPEDESELLSLVQRDGKAINVSYKILDGHVVYLRGGEVLSREEANALLERQAQHDYFRENKHHFTGWSRTSFLT
ncbi:MAG: hypothetical protein ABIB79_01300 [archaeon]